MVTSAHNENYNLKYFLMLMQSVLNDTPAPAPEEKVDWNKLYDIAVKHSLAGMFYYAIEKLDDSQKPKEDFMPYLEQMYREQIVTDLNLTLETHRMLEELSSAGIKCLPVKGINTKADYPVPHLRTMSDVDILCKAQQRLKAEEIFLKNGYIKEGVGEKDTSYRKEEILHYELHTKLITEESPAYDYFDNIWERVTFKDNSNIASMTLEDTYIYMLEHLANHIAFGGAGIRMYMDVYVFLKKNGDKLNREYVDKVLTEISLADFEKKTILISDNWFSGREEIVADSDYALFILDSCTYGRASVTFLSDNLRNHQGESAAKNGFKRIIRKVFPKLSWMRLRFKVVDKLPLLYPIFVPVYLFNRAFISRDIQTKNLGNYFTSSDSEEAKELMAVFTSLGLEKRIRGNYERI